MLWSRGKKRENTPNLSRSLRTKKKNSRERILFIEKIVDHKRKYELCKIINVPESRKKPFLTSSYKLSGLSLVKMRIYSWRYDRVCYGRQNAPKKSDRTRTQRKRRLTRRRDVGRSSHTCTSPDRNSAAARGRSPSAVLPVVNVARSNGRTQRDRRRKTAYSGRSSAVQTYG